MKGKTRSFGPEDAPGKSSPPLPTEPSIDRDEIIEQLRDRIGQLPSLPGIVREVMRLSQDPNAGAPHFEKVIRQDQVLAGKILQVANSSLYAREKKVTTITEAVVLLGLDELKSIVFSLNGSKLLAHKLAWYGYDGTGLWLHSVACAQACRTIGAAAGLKKKATEQMYVAGLIHDIGKVMLGGALQEVARDFAPGVTTAELDVIAVEQAHLSLSHAEAGEMIATHWKLSPDQKAAVRFHHEPAAAGPHSWAAAVVHVADRVSDRVGLGLEGDYRFDLALDVNAAAILSLSPEVLAQCASALRAEADQIRQLYAAFSG